MKLAIAFLHSLRDFPLGSRDEIKVKGNRNSLRVRISAIVNTNYYDKNVNAIKYFRISKKIREKERGRGGEKTYR